MSKYLELSIKEIHALLIDKKITPLDLVNESLNRIEENKDLNIFITVDRESAINKAIELGKIEVPHDNLLFGIPIAIKDNILTKDLLTTCASKMLENFIPLYDASLIKLIKDQQMIIIGKTNLDEFAMGSTTETSYYGVTLNPWDKTRVSGGSSGGSAVSVASRITPLSIGTDTGGSVRQPASFNGIVGMKPTYGRVSRFGIVAFASSLDQAGIMSRDVYENALLLNVIARKDEKDLTSFNTNEDFTRLIGEDIKGMKILVPNYFMSDIVSIDVLNNFKKIIRLLESKGAIIGYADIRFIEEAVNLYQIIAMGEASSNLARFDGIRYGYSYPNPKNLEDLYLKTREYGFGKQVKRRIMVGSYILSGKNAKVYFSKALKIRDDLRKSFKKLYQDYDLIIGPTTVDVAYKIGEYNNNPTMSWMDDTLVMHANMGGFPSMSVPMGYIDKMPIGLNIMGDSYHEALIYKLGYFIEQELNLNLMVGDVDE